MPTDSEIARDLTVIYLQNHYDKNVSDKDLIEKYRETYKKFEDVFNSEPVSKVKVIDRNL